MEDESELERGLKSQNDRRVDEGLHANRQQTSAKDSVWPTLAGSEMPRTRRLDASGALPEGPESQDFLYFRPRRDQAFHRVAISAKSKSAKSADYCVNEKTSRFER